MREAPRTVQLAQQARARFAKHFGYAANTRVAFAPGRINLIGEHTDYNDGLVLPIALDRGVAIAFGTVDAAAPAQGAARILRAHTPRQRQSNTAVLGQIERRAVRGWFVHAAGVAWALNGTGRGLRGADLQTSSDLPSGAGLSSSAALQVAVARALVAVEDGQWNAVEMARLCQRAENEFVGVPCGIMDQFASAASEAGCATLLDCRLMRTEVVRVPGDVAIVVMNTGVRRALANSAYAERRATCEAAVSVFQAIQPSVTSLRDVDEALLRTGLPLLDPVTARRVIHVVRENARVLATVAALRAGDFAGAGALLDQSHESLRDLYEVSGPELDLAVSIARRHLACWGARMTGAGFGGCAIALVQAAEAGSFIREAHAAFRRQVPGAGAFFACRPSGGAHLVETDG